MPCEKPVIAPIDDECCFSCFVEGRGQYTAPLAIVLHEVDDHIEALNNRLENCCHDNPGCHSSFHYGVGHDGRIINWVDPENTAWSFDPTNSDPNCGTCGWSISTQEGVGVDPNLYTINIAISTGILAFNQGSNNSLAQNNYTEDQYEAIVRLTGWLAETHGITVNQNTIWRHCDELDDFPGGCCCESCDSCESYSDFLVSVQECIDGASIVAPILCDTLCDAPITAGAPAYIFGADQDCNLCGRYVFSTPDPAPDVCEQIQALQTTNTPAALLVLSENEAGDACLVTSLQVQCNTNEIAQAVFGINADGTLGFYQTRQRLATGTAANGESLDPATDRVVFLDATDGNIIFTLTAPGLCEPNDFWIKRKDCVDQNTVTINGGTATIDGETAITLGTPGPMGACGEAVHLVWDGTEWAII